MKILFLLPFFFFSAHVSSQSTVLLLDSPELTGAFIGNVVSLTLDNAPSSNNYNENFNVYDPRIQNAPDTTWDFEGYIIYQLDSCRFPYPIQFFGNDTNYVRQVAQCDIANGITTLINHDSASSCQPRTMVVGNDAGILNHFLFTHDAFTGQPFQPGQSYSFTAIAYGHNAYFSDSSCAPLTSPFLRGVHQQFICIQITGVNELSKEHKQLVVFPSPAQNTLTVDLSHFHAATTLSVYDISGQLIQQQTAPGKANYQLDISTLAPGSYFLAAVSNEGSQMARFIKE